MSAYVIYQAEVTDPERYEECKVLASASIAAAGGRCLARGGKVEVLEGEAPGDRTVVVEFPTMRSAVDWYQNAYAEARRFREGASTGRMYVVDGVG